MQQSINSGFLITIGYVAPFSVFGLVYATTVGPCRGLRHAKTPLLHASRINQQRPTRQSHTFNLLAILAGR